MHTYNPNGGGGRQGIGGGTDTEVESQKFNIIVGYIEFDLGQPKSEILKKSVNEILLFLVFSTT